VAHNGSSWITLSRQASCRDASSARAADLLLAKAAPAVFVIKVRRPSPLPGGDFRRSIGRNMRDVAFRHNTATGTRNADGGATGMKVWSCAVLTFPCLIAGAAAAREPMPTAIFPIGFVDTSLEAPRPDELARLAVLQTNLQQALVQSGCCTPIDMTPVAKQVQDMDQPSCNGCDVDMAGKLGAAISVTGWVQKVSNLILNINVVARTTTTGAVIGAGSVDIRGNTDESWSRGLSYLVRNRIHPSDW
jgi:hypothetical protein